MIKLEVNFMTQNPIIAYIHGSKNLNQVRREILEKEKQSDPETKICLFFILNEEIKDFIAIHNTPYQRDNLMDMDFAYFLKEIWQKNMLKMFEIMIAFKASYEKTRSSEDFDSYTKCRCDILMAWNLYFQFKLNLRELIAKGGSHEAKSLILEPDVIKMLEEVKCIGVEFRSKGDRPYGDYLFIKRDLEGKEVDWITNEWINDKYIQSINAIPFHAPDQ
jgi:hypothetical protein